MIYPHKYGFLPFCLLPARHLWYRELIASRGCPGTRRGETCPGATPPEGQAGGMPIWLFLPPGTRLPSKGQGGKRHLPRVLSCFARRMAQKEGRRAES